MLTGVPRVLDPVLVGAEVVARQVRWRLPALTERLRDRVADEEPAPRVVDEDALFARLDDLGVRPGALVMVHSSTSLLHLRRGESITTNPIAVASRLVRRLQQAVGPEGTLCMPTHPLLEGDPPFLTDKRGLELTYDVRRSKARVGLMPNLFLRRPGVRRSRHPLSALACVGPLADELLADDLRPGALPHGEGSPYHRFCQRDGVVVSIGVRLIKAMTILHVAEEVRDGDFPVRGFFIDRRFRVIDGDDLGIVKVRERSPFYVRMLMLEQARRELIREGLLDEAEVDGTAVDGARAGDVLRSMLRRGGTWPYLLPRLARLRA